MSFPHVSPPSASLRVAASPSLSCFIRASKSTYFSKWADETVVPPPEHHHMRRAEMSMGQDLDSVVNHHRNKETPGHTNISINKQKLELCNEATIKSYIQDTIATQKVEYHILFSIYKDIYKRCEENDRSLRQVSYDDESKYQLVKKILLVNSRSVDIDTLKSLISALMGIKKSIEELKVLLEDL